MAVCRAKKNGEKPKQEYLLFDLDKIVPLALFFTLVGITIMMAYVGDTVFIYGSF